MQTLQQKAFVRFCPFVAKVKPGFLRPCKVFSGPRTGHGWVSTQPPSNYQNSSFAARTRVVALSSVEDVAPVTTENLISALAKASNAWEKYDKDRSGRMSLKECEELFNSPEINEAFLLLTNIPARHMTAADLEPYFKRADKDRSGCLTRTEFLALYTAIISERVKKNPLLLAEVLLGFVDKDKNGVLEGSELKPVLAMLGFAPALLLPIPGFLKINYRDILGALGGESGRRSK